MSGWVSRSGLLLSGRSTETSPRSVPMVAGMCFSSLKKFLLNIGFQPQSRSFLGDRDSFFRRLQEPRNCGLGMLTAEVSVWGQRLLERHLPCRKAEQSQRHGHLCLAAPGGPSVRQGPLPLCHLGGRRGPRLPLPSPIVLPLPT